MRQSRIAATVDVHTFTDSFRGTLDPDNRWVLLAKLIPGQELQEAYTPQFSANVGAPARGVSLAFGSLYLKQSLDLTDEKTVLQIQENPYMQFSLGFYPFRGRDAAEQHSTPDR